MLQLRPLLLLELSLRLPLAPGCLRCRHALPSQHLSSPPIVRFIPKISYVHPNSASASRKARALHASRLAYLVIRKFSFATLIAFVVAVDFRASCARLPHRAYFLTSLSIRISHELLFASKELKGTHHVAHARSMILPSKSIVTGLLLLTQRSRDTSAIYPRKASTPSHCSHLSFSTRTGLRSQSHHELPDMSITVSAIPCPEMGVLALPAWVVTLMDPGVQLHSLFFFFWSF